MKIAMVSEHASPLAALGGVDAGGQNVHVAELARAIGARGHEVTVYTRRDDPGLSKRTCFAPNAYVEHIDAGPAAPLSKDELFPYMDEMAARLTRAFDESRPDIVHTHFWMSGYAGLESCRPLAIPLVHTFHALGVVKKRYQGDEDTSPNERAAVEQRLVRSASHIISTCSDEVFELRRLGLSADRVTVVPCGVDLERFRPRGPVEDRRPGWHRVVVVSRLVPRKGIDDVIRALAEVPRAELVIAGGPSAEGLEHDPEVRRLRGVAEEAGVSERVFFRGRLDRNAVAALLRSADVVASTPWYEPFGIVPIEAMACGAPVVATAVGGLIDTVVDGATGLHVPPRDPSSIAQALRWLLDQPGRRIAFGAAGVQRAHGRYGWPRVADATLDVYQSLAGGAARSSSTEAR